MSEHTKKKSQKKAVGKPITSRERHHLMLELNQLRRRLAKLLADVEQLEILLKNAGDLIH